MILCSIFLFLLLHVIIKMLFSCCKTPDLSISKIFLLLGQTKNKKNYIQQSAEYLHLIFPQFCYFVNQSKLPVEHFLN